MAGRRSRIVFAALVATLRATVVPAQQPAVTAFVDVNVVPMDRDRVLAHQTVLVWGSHIATIGPTGKVSVPSGAFRIDGRGKFLLPGLADMHTHFEVTKKRDFSDGKLSYDMAIPDLLVLYLANGITTIRYPGGNASTLKLRNQLARGELLGPRMYTARGNGFIYAAKTFEDLTRGVAEAKDSGYDFIKVQNWPDSFTAAQFDTFVTATHRVGIPFVGHTPNALGLLRMLQGKPASIEHLTGYNAYLLSPDPTTPLQSVSNPRLNALLADTAQYEWKIPLIAALTKQAGVWNCPTLITLKASYDRRVLWRDTTHASKDSLAALSAGVLVARRRILVRGKLVKALHEVGAGLLLGTDGPGGFDDLPIRPLSEVQVELEMFVDAGLTPYEALATGTRNVAEYFGILDSAGTIATGKRADLVLLRDNPLRDVRAVGHPVGTMLGGHWFAAAELKARLAANGVPAQWYPE